MKPVYMCHYSPEMSYFKELSQLESVNKLKAMGISGVFGGYDDDEFIDLMHENDMKVYASMGCFVGKQFWNQYPESRPIKSNGESLEEIAGYCGVIPTHKIIRQERLDALKHLANDTKADGIWLDFIRWPYRWEKNLPIDEQMSFDKITIQQFKEYTDIKTDLDADIILDKYPEQWTQFKCDTITSWVKDAYEIIKKTDRDVILGMFSVPWQSHESNDRIKRVTGQDLSALNDFMDVMSPMVYHQICNKPIDWIEKISKDAIEYTDGANVWPIIQSIDFDGILETDEYKKTIIHSLGIDDIEGVMIYQLESHLDKLGFTPFCDIMNK
jgi:hypothetical protein